jgi:hypothetical protein
LISTSVSVATDTRFSEPFSSNGLFWLSDIMSQYEYYIYRLRAFLLDHGTVIFKFIIFYRWRQNFSSTSYFYI